MGQEVIEALFRIKGESVGVDEVVANFKKSAEDASNTAIKMSENVVIRSEAYMNRLQERATRLQVELTRLGELRGVTGQTAVAANTSALVAEQEKLAQSTENTVRAQTASAALDRTLTALIGEQTVNVTRLTEATQLRALAEENVARAEQRVIQEAAGGTNSSRAAAAAEQVRSQTDLTHATAAYNAALHSATTSGLEMTRVSKELAQVTALGVSEQVKQVAAQGNVDRLNKEGLVLKREVASADRLYLSTQKELDKVNDKLAQDGERHISITAKTVQATHQGSAAATANGTAWQQTTAHIRAAGTAFTAATTIIQRVSAPLTQISTAASQLSAAWSAMGTSVGATITRLAVSVGTGLTASQALVHNGIHPLVAMLPLLAAAGAVVVTTINGMRAGMSPLATAMTSGASASQVLHAAWNLLTTTLTALRPALTASIASFASVVSVMGHVVGAAVTLTRAIGPVLGGAFHAAGEGISKVKGMLGGLAEGFATTNTHVAGLAVKLQGIQMGLYATGGSMTQFATSAISHFKNILDIAGEFQTKILTITSILGETTPKVAAQLEQLSLSLSQSTMYAPTEIAGVVEELVKAGESIDEIMGGATKAVLNLSSATGQDLAESVRSIIVATQGWKDENVSAADAADLLTRMANATISTVKDLTEGMKNSGAAAVTMGINLKDNLTLIGQLAETGMKGGQSGTALSYFYMNLVPATTKALDVMKQLGIATFNATDAAKELTRTHSRLGGTQEEQLDRLYQKFAGSQKTFAKAIEDGDKNVGKFQSYLVRNGVVTSGFVDQATGQLKSAADIFQILYDKLALGPDGKLRGKVDQEELLQGLFSSKNGLRAAAPILEAFTRNMELYKKLTDDLAAATTRGDTVTAAALQKRVDAMRPNLINQIQAQTETLGSAQEVGKTKMEGYAGSVKYMTSSFEALQIVAGQPLLDTMSGLLRSIGDVANKIGELVHSNPEIVKIVGLFGMVAAGFAAIAGPLLIVSAAWPLLVTAITGMAVAAAPIAIILGGIAAVLMALVIIIGDPNSGLSGALAKAGSLFKDTLATAMNVATGVILNYLLPAGRAIANFIVSELIPGIFSLAQWFIQHLPQAINLAVSIFKNVLIPVFTNVVDFLKVFIPAALSLFAQAWDKLLAPAIRTIGGLVINWLIPTLSSLGHWLETVLPRAITFLASAFNNVVVPIVTTVALVISRFLIPAFEKISEWILVNGPPIMQFFAGLWRDVVQPIIMTVGGILVNVLLPAILNVMTALRENGAVVATVISVVMVPAILAWVAALLAAAVEAVIAFAPILLAAAVVAGAIFLVKTAWENDFLGIKEAASAFGTFLAGVADFIGFVWDTLNGRVHTAAKGIGYGFKDGVSTGVADGVIAVNTGTDLITQKVASTADAVKAPAVAMGDNIKTALTDAFNGCLTLTKDWSTETLGTLVDTNVSATDKANIIGNNIKSQLEEQLKASLPKTVEWRNQTLETLVSMASPSAVCSAEIGNRIQFQLSLALGRQSADLKNWRTLTLDQLVAMATPAGSASTGIGNALKDKLNEKLHGALTNVTDWRSMTLGALQSMVNPAGDAGFKAGAASSAGIANGLSSNLEAIVARVKFMREQLGIALDIETRLQIAHGENTSWTDKKGKSHANGLISRDSVDEVRAGNISRNRQRQADTALSAAGAAGVPSFLVDVLAGPNPLNASYDSYTNTGKPGNGGDGSTPRGGGPTGGNGYDTNTNAHGDGKGGGGGKSGSGTTMSPAEKAAKVAKDIADAIKAGVDALRMIGGLQVPSNLDAKANEFATAVSKLVMAFQKVALQFGDKALDHTTKFAEAADKVVATLSKGIDSFEKLKDFTAPSHASITAFTAAVAYVVAQVAQIATKFKDEALTHTGIFADSALKVMDLIAKGVDGLSKVDGFVAPAQESVQTLVNSIGQVMTMIRPLAEKWAPQALVVVSEFADAASKVTDSLSKSADLFIKLNSSDVILTGAADKAMNIARQTDTIMRALREMVTKNGWNAKDSVPVIAFAEAAAKVADALTKGVDFINKLNDPKINLSDVTDKMKAVAIQTGQMMQYMTSLVMDLPGKPGVNEKNYEHVTKFAESAAKVADGLTKGLDFFQKLLDPKYLVGDVTARVRNIAEQVTAMMGYISQLWKNQPAMDSKTAESTGKFADATAKVSDSLSKAFDLFDKLAKAKTTNFTALNTIIQDLANATAHIMQVFIPLVPTWDSTADSVSKFADASAKVADSLSKAFDLFEKLGKSKTTSFTGLNTLVQDLVNATSHMMQVFIPIVPKWDSTADSVSKFADATAKVADSLIKAMDLFDKLGKSKTDFTGLNTRIQDLTNATNHLMQTFVPIVPTWDGVADSVSKFADATSKVADSLGKTMVLFDNISKNKTTFTGLTGKVAELIAGLADMMKQISSSVPADYVDTGLNVFVDSATKTADALVKVLDLMANLGKNQKLGNPEDLKKLAGFLVAAVTSFTQSLSEANIALNTDSVDISNITAKLAEDQSKIIGVLGTTLDFMTKLGQYVTPKVDPATFVQPLLSFMDLVLGQFNRLQSQFAKEVTDESTNTAKLIGESISGIAKAVDLFVKLGTYVEVPVSTVDSFIESLRYVVSKLKTLPGEIAPDMLELAAAFGTKLDPAFKLMETALGFFLKLMPTVNEKGKSTGGFNGLDPSRVDSFISGLKYIIEKLRDGLLTQIAPETLELASAFGTKIAPAIDTLTKALDLFLKIDKLKPVDPDAIGALVGNLYILLHHWNNVVIGGEFQGDFTTRSAKFAATATQVLDTINKVLSLADVISTMESKNKSISQLPVLIGQIATGLKAAMVAMGAQTQDETNEQVEGTIMYWWANKGVGLLFRMWSSIEGKGGMRPILRLAFAGMMTDIGNSVSTGVTEVMDVWTAAMTTMRTETISTLAAIKAALSDFASGSVTVTIGVNYSGGNGGGGGNNPTNPNLPPPPGGPPPGQANGNGNATGMNNNTAGMRNNGNNGVTNHFHIDRMKVDRVTDTPDQIKRDRALSYNPA